MEQENPDPPRSLIALLLHDVTDRPENSGFQQPTAQKYKHPVKLFSDYLQTVGESGLRVTRDSLQDASESATQVRFTFDDGGVAALHTADLLEEQGWRGLFFVTTELIGKRGFLSEVDVRELAQRGHAIGSHSCSHPDIFSKLKRSDMFREWSQSRQTLEQLTGSSVHIGSVPGGDCNERTIKLAGLAGIRELYTSEQLTVPWRQHNVTCYGRLMMLRTTRADTLRRWLDHPWLGVLPERALRFTKSSVKKMIGPVYNSIMERRRALHESA